jgi:hypothetical protein
MAELELELIQTQMAQKPMLRVEMYARAVEPEEGVKLAHGYGRLQSDFPVRAKTSRQTITSDGTPGFFAWHTLAGAKRLLPLC